MVLNKETKGIFLKIYKKLEDLEELRIQGLLKIDERDNAEREGKEVLERYLPDDSLAKRKYLKQYSSTQWTDVVYGQFASNKDTHLEKLKQLFDEILQEEGEQKNKDGQHIKAGEVYEARRVLRDIFSVASESIWIQDNYLDSEIIPILKPYKLENESLEILLLTKNEDSSLLSDVKLFNKEYKPIEYKKNDKAHDRYIVIDKEIVYSLGGSIKDLGKKASTITRINDDKVVKDILSDFREWKESSVSLI